MKAKCIPILLYATEVCPLFSREKNSFEFAITRLFMKIFKTGSPTIVVECQRYFAFLPVTHQVTIRIAKFLQCFIASKNSVCSLFTDVATTQLNCIFCAHGDTVGSVRDLTDIIYKLHCN